MTSAFSWKNSISLCPTSFCTPRPNLCVLQVSIGFLFCLPIPYDVKHIFFWRQFQKGFQVFIELFSFFGWGIDCVLLDFSLGFPGSSTCKESACNAGDPRLIPGLGRFPGEGISNRFWYSCLFQFQLFVIALVYIFYFFLFQSQRVVSF